MPHTGNEVVDRYAFNGDNSEDGQLGGLRTMGRRVLGMMDMVRGLLKSGSEQMGC
jgi:hypothetical protein